MFLRQQQSLHKVWVTLLGFLILLFQKQLSLGHKQPSRLLPELLAGLTGKLTPGTGLGKALTHALCSRQSALCCQSPDGGPGQESGTLRHKAQRPQLKAPRTVILCQNLTHTIPLESFQTLPGPSLSQQVFRHRWKISTLKRQESREGFRKGRDWAGCQCPGATRWTLDSPSSPPASSPTGKQKEGSHRPQGLRRQEGQRQREGPCDTQATRDRPQEKPHPGLTTMSAGEKARFCRGSKRWPCPHRRMTAVWITSSATGPSRLLSPAHALSRGSVLVTRDVAKCLMFGEDRTLLSSMNLCRASQC